MITAYFDGLCEPVNPAGVATYGFVILSGKDTVHTDCGLACAPYTPQATNNYAEYTAMVKALRFCELKGFHSVKILGDSQLVINQMTGRFSVNSPNILPLYVYAKTLVGNIPSISFAWIPREENQIADGLSRKAYTEFIDKNKDRILMPFGKYKGQPIRDIARKDPGYIAWAVENMTCRDASFIYTLRAFL